MKNRDQNDQGDVGFAFAISGFVIPSSLVIRASSFSYHCGSGR
jgi:hypothetical protein